MLTHARPPGSRWLATLLTGVTLLQLVAANTPPQFISFPTALFPSEDTSVGTVLASLSASDADDQTLNFVIRGDVANSLLDLQKTSPTSANIVLASQLDTEVVDAYTVLFEVSDSAGNVIQRYCSIYVADVNDNSPSFVKLPYRGFVPEDTPMGTFVFRVTATDPDTGVGGLVSYNITANRQTQDGLFNINTGTGEVTLAQDLDFETEKFYQLEIMAIDGGGLNSTTDLIINVEDVQDTAPFFLNLPYVASIPEDASVGAQVLRVTAMDGDRGAPNQVAFSFSGGLHDYFNIDSTSGSITVKTELDREDDQVIAQLGALEMTVKAEEITSDPKGETTATAIVSIRILDINDQSPTFGLSSYEGVIQENAVERIPVTLLPIGTEISVKDMDDGDNGRFEVHLEKNGLAFDVFEVYPTTVLNEAQLVLRVKDPSVLDYETVQEFTFEIVATEYLTPDLFEGRTQVRVQLEDVNDNWPQFTQDVFNTSVFENSPMGTYVTEITATDRDSGEFGEIKYSLRGATSSLFAIAEDTGIITVNVNADTNLDLLDRERISEHYLSVEAIDGGGLRTLVQLGIKLLDVNDNPPLIVRTFYEGFVSENADSLDRPLIIEASDADLPPNNEISFSIYDGDPLNNFTIDSSTGAITVVSPLNYEEMDADMDGAFHLRILSSDGGSPSLSSFINVTIYVQDLNDVEPYFQPVSYSSSVAENSIGGTFVTQVSAFDNDGTSPNNEIIYRIESGAQDKFRIDAETGQLTVEYGADLDRDKFPDSYSLTVLAIDRGTPPNTGTGTVLISITDINNKIPIFTPSRQSIRVPENTPVGVVFITYPALDSDLNADLEYSLIEEDIQGYDENGQEFTDKNYLKSLFGVRTNDGGVYVKSELDREIVEEIEITIFVKDKNAQEPAAQNNTAQLTIVLADINDQPPIFTPSPYYTARVSEAAKPGTEIVRVVAIDYDKNPGTIEYRMIYDTNESLSFEITTQNRQTGVITLARSVDQEEANHINITVIAQDDGSPPMQSQAWVQIYVEDVNDNSPQWQIFPDSVEIYENSPLYTDVTQILALDDDSGELGHVMYFLASDAPFLVHNESGLIQTFGVLDRETNPVYDITIEARDNNGAAVTQQRRTPGYMQIILKDINDNSPEFEQSTYQASTLENANLNHVFANVRAFDSDAGTNADLSYTIDYSQSNSSTLFNVHTDSGSVFVHNSLQGQMGIYHVVITATDHGDPPLSNQTSLLVTVLDVNDHKPIIEEPPVNETINILENVTIGYDVTQVIANDKDEGINGQVEYEFVESLARLDWKYFTIDKITGEIRTALNIDREKQEFYYVEVRAYDLGKPQYDDRRTIIIKAMDLDDNPPEFDRSSLPPPYVVSVEEEKSNIYIGNLNVADDPDIGENAKICYFIVGGERPYVDQFHMNMTTGDLWLEQSLDREALPSVNLIIKATELCAEDYWQRQENQNIKWNDTDLTLLWVKVNVDDINDNAPAFTKKWFTAGVTRDTQYGSDVINLRDYAIDSDEGTNAEMTFNIQTDPYISPQLRNDLQGKTPFTLDPVEGVIKTNVYFQEVWQGYIEFTVSVNDSSSDHLNKANVSIYLLSEEQRVKVIIRGEPDEVGNFRDDFAEFVSAITGTIINVDNIRTHKDDSGDPDRRKTDMFIHAINPENGEVIASHVLIDLIDRNYDHLIDLFNQYNVIEVVPSVEVTAASTLSQNLFLALIVTAIVLGLLLILIFSTFIFCRRKYKRKLKAATAMAFDAPHISVNGGGRHRGSHDNGLNRLEMPNTNQHTFEGSNPIWLEQYENGWPEDSDTDSKNSLDENAVEPANKTKSYDEQEATMGMYNDEYDHYNQVPAPKHRDGDIILKTALQEHDKANNGHPVSSNGSAKRTTSPNGSIPQGYHNHGFQLQATEI